MKQWVLTTQVLMARLLPGYHYRQVRALRRQVWILHRHRHRRRHRHRHRHRRRHRRHLAVRVQGRGSREQAGLEY